MDFWFYVLIGLGAILFTVIGWRVAAPWLSRKSGFSRP